MEILTILVTLILCSIILCYVLLKRKFNYWERHGFKQLTPCIPFGNMKDFAKKKKSFGIVVWDLYQKTTEAFIGTYVFTSPSLLIRDVELVKAVLTTDFEHFYDRGSYINEKREPMSASLVSQRGQKWKILRQKLTPLFSSGKLKNMFPTILAQVDHLGDYLDVKNNQIVEIKTIITSYVLNVIGSVFFGYDLDMINDPDHAFRQIHAKITNPSAVNRLRGALSFMAPKLLDLFRIPRFSADVKEFFMDVVHSTIQYRETTNYTRNDFMQLMIDLRKQERTDTHADSKLTIGDIAGNSFIFYIAGTETTSLTASHCIYELALQPKLMKLAQKEVDSILNKYDNKLTYDSLQDMPYVEMCVKETLRKYPGLPMLNRICTKDYKIPGTNNFIKKGTPIVISAMGLHYDPKYFEKPYDFIPERFSKGEETYNKDAYLPFGDGPRQCVAVRMGFLGAKAAIVKLLSKFNFEALDDKPIEFASHSVGLTTKGGLPLRISRR